MKKFTSLLIFISSLGYSQDSDLGNWLIYIGSKKIDSKWNIHNEVQYRNYNAIGDLEQLLLRTGVGYNLSPNNNNLLLGYGLIRSENYNVNNEKSANEEHRIYQQFVTKQSFGRVSWQHRYRLEERFTASGFKVRFRYFLAAKVALNKPTLEKNTFYISAYNEIFINNKETFFDRNRIYGGFGYVVNKNVKLELGYMNQLFSVGSRDQVNVIGVVNF
mgnify:FL=1|jgi:hypothetical protein|tara:strand:+ start:441 stop:1091 length:651 start_codon:yes stop_codon:yes gene_type:complete